MVKFEYPDKFANMIKDVPDGEHYAILVQESYSTEDSYNPGTYDSHKYLSYEVYNTREKWEEKIRYLESDTGYSKKSYKAIVVRPAKIGVTISVDVK